MRTYNTSYTAQPGQPLQPVEVGDRFITAQEYLHTPQAGALVPLAQAAVTGALVAAIVCTVLVWQKVSDSLVFTLLSFLVVTLVSWVVLQRHWFSLTAVERFTGLDINGDGRIGDKSIVKSHVVEIDLRTRDEGGYLHSAVATLPVRESDFVTVARGVAAGRPFTEREWTGADNPLSINQFKDVRAEMIKRGILEPVNRDAPQQGYKFTRSGKAVLAYFAALPPTSSVDGSENG
jgi:hypothetical protein